jgi:hypothetical protein
VRFGTTLVMALLLLAILGAALIQSTRKTNCIKAAPKIANKSRAITRVVPKRTTDHLEFFHLIVLKLLVQIERKKFQQKK